MTPKQRRVCSMIGLALAIAAGGLCWACWEYLFRTAPERRFSSPEDRYKHGSLGLLRGFPLDIWNALPRMFPEKFEGQNGWKAFGLLVEEESSVPVGLSVRRVGFHGLNPNCALCHTGSYRTAPSNPAIIVPGAPAHQLDFDRFNQIVFDCFEDPRFTPANVLQHVRANRTLSWSEYWFCRLVLIPATRAKILREKQKFEWQKLRPPAGRGRTDAFNRFKINLLGLPDDGTIGTSDYPPLWNQKTRAGLWLHWNGSGNRLSDENLLSLLPVIGSPQAFQADAFTALTNYLAELTAPPYPLPVDAGLALRGQAVFQSHCAACHAFGAEKVGQVTPLQEVKTDPNFLAMWTEAFVNKLQAYNQPPFRFGAIRRTEGYVNVPLDGCWLRAPYLHNGSVPTLWDLLQPAEKRPVRFYRGYDVLDSDKVGFISEGPEAQRTGTLYDTSLPGNGNGGHDYGTELTAEDKQALLEYLKTL